jgi:hypothetical protein
MRKMIGALAAATLLPISVITTTGNAYAADEHYKVCVDEPGTDCVIQFSEGYITWYNRTAHISGGVTSTLLIDDRAQVVFNAFAGTTLIDTQTRTTAPGGTLGFGFDIGDTNLVGGIDRIRITVCKINIDNTRECSYQHNYWK